MARPAYIEVNLGALRHNYAIAKRLSTGALALAVVKADAYGHGAVQVASALADSADGFGVACIEEALDLRNAGIENPILLLEGVFCPSELMLAARHGLWVTVHSEHQLQWLLGAELPRPVQVWLKLDSGMHRLGFDPKHYAAAHEALRSSENVASIVLMSHYARADEADLQPAQRQDICFAQTTQKLAAQKSMANSAAILQGACPTLDWTRPGLMLYGLTPLQQRNNIETALRPAMTLVSEIIATHEVAQCEPIGYGSHFITQRPTRIGVVAMGYGDGYPRLAPNGTPVAVNGVRTRLLGRVSMDMLTVDLSRLPNSQHGDRVELWGGQISVTEVASCCQTIPYELVTRMTKRVARRYTSMEEA